VSCWLIMTFGKLNKVGICIVISQDIKFSYQFFLLDSKLLVMMKKE
jgi:hypothetical protein